MKNPNYNDFLKLYDKISKVLNSYLTIDSEEQISEGEVYRITVQETVNGDLRRQMMQSVNKMLNENDYHTDLFDNIIDISGNQPTPFIEIKFDKVDKNTFDVELVYTK